MKLVFLIGVFVVNRSLEACPDPSLLLPCTCENTTKNFECSATNTTKGYLTLPQDLFKNISAKLGTDKKQDAIEFTKVTFPSNGPPILWDVTFEKIVFNDCEIKDSLNTFANNYEITTNIEIHSSIVSAGFFQELGRFKNLEKVIVNGPNYDPKTKVINSLGMKNNTFYPYNGFQDKLSTIEIRNYNISMASLKDATLPFYYLRNINEITFQDINFQGAGVFSKDFLAFSKGETITTPLKLSFINCEGLLDKKLFDDKVFSNLEREVHVTFDIQHPTSKDKAIVLDESYFKFVLEEGRHIMKSNLTIDFTGMGVDCFDCKNEWLMIPDDKKFKVKCDDGKDLDKSPHFFKCH